MVEDVVEYRPFMELASGYETVKPVLRDFQPCQIVYLEHQASRLYAEVIQAVESRQVCWVRPLILIEHHGLLAAYTDPVSLQSFHVYDLRQGCDLLFPIALFQAATDVETIYWISALYTPMPHLEGNSIEAAEPRQLNQFVQQLYDLYPEKF